MAYNQNHSWGRMIAESLKSRPRVGKILVVVGETNVNFEELNEIFPATDKIRVVTTLQAAIDLTTASSDDTIFVAPYHTENITAAATVALNKAGVSIIGLGHGTSRPTFTWTTAIAASWDVSAADCWIENFLFDLTGFDAVTAGFNITAANCTFKNNEFIVADGGGQAALAILTTAAASGLRLEGNKFFGTTNAGTAAAVRIVGGSKHYIRDNLFIGAYTTSLGAIDNATTEASQIFVGYNVIQNRTASSTKAMVFVSTSTGFIVNNHMQILSGDDPITGAAMSWGGINTFAAAIATTVIAGRTQQN